MPGPEDRGLLVLAGSVGDGGGDSAASDLFRSQPAISYNEDERRLSLLVQRELDRIIVGGSDQLVLLKLYPRRDRQMLSTAGENQQPQGGATQAEQAESERQMLHVAWPAVNAGAVHAETAVQIAAEAIGFFGPLHGGVATQTAFPDVIVQGRRFTTTYPHINLERYDVYDSQTREPLLGAWRARRLQNQRRETRTNRMIDIALLVLEVGQAVFPRLLG